MNRAARDKHCGSGASPVGTVVGVRRGGTELDLARLELGRGGDVVQIEPRLLDLRACLITRRDRVVLKSQLLDTLWSDRFVSETAVTSDLRSVRRAIGDQRWMGTGGHGRGHGGLGRASRLRQPR